MASSPLAALSPDCKHHVLSFLVLSDCLLAYSQVSQQALRDVLPNLQKRHARQFLERHAYQISLPTRWVPVQEVPSLVAANASTAGPEIFLRALNGDPDQWHVMPSVAERLQGLYQVLPQSHSSWEDVRQLVHVVTVPQPSEEEEEDLPGRARGNSFAAALATLRSLMTAHKLHDAVLSQSTVTSNPPLAVRGGNNDNANNIVRANESDNHTSLTITLDQYMGDVYVAYYLMGHAIGGMVEGPISSSTWKTALFGFPEGCFNDDPLTWNTMLLQQGVNPAVKWYRWWVFVHSRSLRMSISPLSAFATPMNLAPVCGIIEEYHPSFSTEEYHDPEEEWEWEEVKEVFRATYVHPPLPLFERERVDANFDDIFDFFRFQAFSVSFWGHTTRIDNDTPRGSSRIMMLTPPEYSRRSRERHDGRDHAAIASQRLKLRRIGHHQDVEWGFRTVVDLSRECHQSRPTTLPPPLVTIADSGRKAKINTVLLPGLSETYTRFNHPTPQLFQTGTLFTFYNVEMS